MADAHFDAVDRRHASESAILDESTLDDKMHYRFIQERPTQIARAKLKGYRVVRPSEDGVKTLYDQEDKPAEDIVKHGDRVLMAIPKAKNQERRSVLRKRALQRLESHDQRVRDLAKEKRVKLHETDDEED